MPGPALPRRTAAFAMIGFARACALVALAGSLAGSPLAAQQPGQPALGFVVGLGRVPSAVDRYCGHPVPWHARGVLAEARAALPLGRRFSVEGRLSAQTKVALYSCGGIVQPVADGTYWTREYYLHGDGFAGADLRLRYDVPRVPLVLSGGAGQLWGLKAPDLVFGPGLRLGRRLRLIVDGDLIYAHVPFNEVVTVWRGGVPEEVVVRVPRNEWRTLGGGRLGIELGLR